MPTDDPSRSGYAVLAGRIFDGHAWRSDAAVLIGDGRVVAVVGAGDVPDGWPRHCLPQGAMLAPGFIDLQVNGGGGILLNDAPVPETLRSIARAHRRFGTTACLPTLITAPRQETQAAIAAARAVAGTDGVLGIHLEGPFISPARPGIHRPDHIAMAEWSDLDWLGDVAGAGASMITLAPERLPDRFLSRLAATGVRVAVGHSEASAQTVLRAVDEGLSGVTHLFNAMPPLAGRQPGIVGAALAERRLTAGIIADGIHVEPTALRAAFAAKRTDRIALVTDAMPTVGTEVTQFQLMGRTISRRDGRLCAEDGTLAGAHLNMAAAVRNAVKLAQLSLGDALVAASRTPAEFLGLVGQRGVLVPGARADMVALTPELEVLSTWIDGVE